MERGILKLRSDSASRLRNLLSPGQRAKGRTMWSLSAHEREHGWGARPTGLGLALHGQRGLNQRHGHRGIQPYLVLGPAELKPRDAQ